MAAQRGNQVESDESYKRRVRLYARAVPGMHRAGPGERGGASYGRRAVATVEWAAMQISVAAEGRGFKREHATRSRRGDGLGGAGAELVLPASERVVYPRTTTM